MQRIEPPPDPTPAPRGTVAAPAADATDRDTWPSIWRSLRWFAWARLVVAAVLAAWVPLLRGIGGVDDGFDAGPFGRWALLYLVAAVAIVATSRPGRLPLRTLAAVQVAIDLVGLMLLIHAAGGVRTGLAILLILPTAGAAILLSARLALFFAALAALALLADTGWRVLGGTAGEATFVPAGLFGAALLATAGIVGRLAARLEAQERLAWQRGRDLHRQLAVTRAVIGDLADGVVVMAEDGAPRAINPSAHAMLGGPGSGADATGTRAALPGLALLHGALQARGGRAGEAGGADAVDLLLPGRAPGGPRRVRARRLAVPREVGDTVVVLEDLDRLEARAQQLKLASMGRLSASIAHEVRNPLAAIRHANGLLAERVGEPALARLSTIVEQNCLRIDRIIEDVLSISRRGAADPEAIGVATFVGQVVAEYIVQSDADPRRVACRAECDDPLWFDAGHLRQVLLNLLANALRHASDAPGAVRVSWARESGGRAVLAVADDGPGVPESSRPHLFEPFFTTEVRGTGLGLHLARELCSANGATIRYRPPCQDPPVRSAFVVEPGPQPAAAPP